MLGFCSEDREHRGFAHCTIVVDPLKNSAVYVLFGFEEFEKMVRLEGKEELKRVRSRV